MGLTGLILAGGENTRFEGLPKGALKWDGESLFDRVHRALDSVVDEVHVSIHENRPPGVPEDLPVVEDRMPDVRGPMVGVYSALVEINRPLLVLTWDMPGVNALFLRHMADQYDPDSEVLAWYVQNGEQSHPFPGIYTPKATDGLEDALEKGNWGMITWLKNHSVEVVDVTEQAPTPNSDQQLMNINKPSDIKNVFREL